MLDNYGGFLFICLGVVFNGSCFFSCGIFSGLIKIFVVVWDVVEEDFFF